MNCMFGFYQSRRQDDKAIASDGVASVVVVRLSLETTKKEVRGRDRDPGVDVERDNQGFLQQPKAERPRVLWRGGRGPVD